MKCVHFTHHHLNPSTSNFSCGGGVLLPSPGIVMVMVMVMVGRLVEDDR